MKREAQKRQTAHPRECERSLSLRCHAATERFPARDQRQLREDPESLSYRCPNRCMGQLRAIRALGAMLHVRKLIPQCGNAAFGKSFRHRNHERVGHSRTCAMGEDIAGSRPRRRQQEARHAMHMVDLDGDRLRVAYQGRLTASTALSPPKAKELDSAASIDNGLASFGTQSRSQAGSGPR